MCACYTDIDLRLQSDADQGYPRNCSPSSHPRGEMKFSEMIPPSFLLNRIQQTSKRPKCKPSPAAKVKCGKPKSSKCKRNVGVNTCEMDEVPCQHSASNCDNIGSNMLPEYSTLCPVPNQIPVCPTVRPAGLPSKTCPPFDPCTGQEIGLNLPKDCGRFISCSTPQMQNTSSGFCSTAQYYPMAPEAYISEPSPPQQCTYADSKPSSATIVTNANAKSCSSKHSVNACASRLNSKLQNHRNRCSQKLMKVNKWPIRGVSGRSNVINWDRDRTRTCGQVRVNDKSNCPSFGYTLKKYGVKKSNYNCLSKNKYPRHDCLSKDKPTSSYKCNLSVSSKEKSYNCNQPSICGNQFIHCAAERPNLLERICNSMQIPPPPQSCYILLPLNMATKCTKTGKARCADEDTKSFCTDKSIKSKSSKSVRTRGCNTDVSVNDKLTTDNEDDTTNSNGCTSGFSCCPRRNYYFNPYTGHYHPWYSPSYSYRQCCGSCLPSYPTSCPILSSQSKASFTCSCPRSCSCSPSKSSHSAFKPNVNEMDNRWVGAQYRSPSSSKPPSPTNSCPYPPAY